MAGEQSELDTILNQFLARSEKVQNVNSSCSDESYLADQHDYLVAALRRQRERYEGALGEYRIGDNAPIMSENDTELVRILRGVAQEEEKK